ncbi:unnamed protein product [Bursaphelenchus okinawaensis]|uniref:RRM domain-containing protein n=1 Tax=Bursaphelenchus okinawaensis TaxID=465554 RepID=A0A811K2T9_9BILA|nr:unnamed protein product [Bursaphelenchus okinawaensis]CAG9090947.1 unnamed protein product [Bursaphelenchus okinawaensis]
MPKRASEDLVGAACFDEAFSIFMNTMSEPKKLKLDPLAFISAPAPASKSASAAAAVAAAAVLNFNSTASASTVSAPDPSGNPPSRVVHLRNIPGDMSELELIHFCMPFGKLSNYLMLKGKNQAFVEYEEESGAQAIVQIAHAYPMAIRGKTIFCQYSTHQNLKTEKKLPTKSGAILGDLVVPPARAEADTEAKAKTEADTEAEAKAKAQAKENTQTKAKTKAKARKKSKVKCTSFRTQLLMQKEWHSYIWHL